MDTNQLVARTRDPLNQLLIAEERGHYLAPRRRAESQAPIQPPVDKHYAAWLALTPEQRASIE